MDTEISVENSAVAEGVPTDRKCILVQLVWESEMLLRGILAYAREADLAVINLRLPLLRPARMQMIDGVIGTFRREYKMADAYQTAGLPLVDLAYGSRTSAATVLSDNEKIGRMAAEHYRSRGFRRVAALDMTGGPASMERMQSFCLAAGEMGMHTGLYSISEQLSWQDDLRPGMEDWVQHSLEQLEFPCAVFCSNDDQAMFVMNVALSMGVRVPENLAVLGVDCDPTICDFSLVSLSSVDTGLERVGYEGARLLHQMILGEPAPEKPVLIAPRGVITRKSTDILAVEDPHVAQLVHYIREHFCEDITADDAVASVPLSRSQLYRRFKEEVGHSVGQEILRMRMKEARRLLMETDEKLYAVAVMCGFSSMNTFCRTFKRCEGLSPGAYRERHSSDGG